MSSRHPRKHALITVPASETVLIEKLVPGGQGLATLPSGKKAFFWNALPGEQVTEYLIAKQKSKYIEAIVTKFSDPSPRRIAPKDPCYLSTSPWQILDYDYELTMKRELLLETFRQNGLSELCRDIEVGQNGLSTSSRGALRRSRPSYSGATPATAGGRDHGDAEDGWQPVLTDGNDFYYRNKMEYSLYYDHSDEKIYLAFHKRGSHAKIRVDQSSIERPEIFERAREIVAELNAKGDEARKYQSLLLRCDKKGNVSGGLYENGRPHPVFPNLRDTILDHEYSYSPNGFFQINLPVYELALAEIKQHIATEKVLDLYAGVGTIGLSVARDKELTLVEVDKSAYKELEHNCKNVIKSNTSLGDENCGKTPFAILAKSEEALDSITPNQTVILDPPRAGIDKKLTAKLLEVLPETIIYLSCNPSTQARDLKYLTENHKYQITKVQPYNFFPRTPHLENLVILQKD